MTNPLPHPLRVALISEHASPLAPAGSVDAGGQNVYVAHVAQGLAALGHRVDVLTRRDHPALPATVVLQHGVRVLHVDAGPACFVPREELLPHMPAFTAAARRLLSRHAPYDVLHANFFMSGWVGLALRQDLGVPLVITFHGLGLVRREHERDADGFPTERIAIERVLAQRSDRVLASCPQDEADLLRLYGTDPARITQVPYGVDTQALRPGDCLRARQRLGLPADEFILLQAGRLVPRQGVGTGVQALALLQQQPGPGPAQPCRLVVMGGGSREPDEAVTPEIGRLRRLAEGLGVASQVQFVGQRRPDELRDWYLAADVFVTTPWYEPLDIATLEAMACGTPVVGSAVGGAGHTVQDGITGYLVPPQDAPALAARLQTLRAHPGLGAALGRAGAHRVRTHFTWEQVAQRLAQVYAALRRPRAAAREGAPRLLPALHTLQHSAGGRTARQRSTPGAAP